MSKNDGGVEQIMPGANLTSFVENLLIKIFINRYENKSESKLNMDDSYIELRHIIGNERNTKNIDLSDFRKSVKIAEIAIESRAEMIGYDIVDAKLKFKELTDQLIKDCFSMGWL